MTALAVAPRADQLSRSPRSTRSAGLLLALGLLAVLVVASLALGARSIPFDRSVTLLFAGDDGSIDGTVLWNLRVPRTLLGLEVGIALALAGVVLQSVTRNPLADTGLLGVNAGAAAAVVLAISALDYASVDAYVWFAFAGAAIALLVVYGIAALGRGGISPTRLVLAGVAVTAALESMISAVSLRDSAALEQYRAWVVGSLGGRDAETVATFTPFLAVGLLLALACIRPLNALALGEDLARSLGGHVGRTRIASAGAVILLAGGATAAAGPIAFVGLLIPHLVRAMTGPDLRWVVPYSMVLGPCLLLGADVVGRLVVRPGELQVGILTAVLGAPLLIVLVRRLRLVGPA